MVLRLVVFLLALAAAGKIGWQEYAYRSALRDTVALTFRDRAVRACEGDSRTLKLALPVHAWTSVDSVHVRVAKSEWTWPWSSGDVHQAAGRSGHPLLVLAISTETGNFACTYNVMTSVATVERT